MFEAQANEATHDDVRRKTTIRKDRCINMYTCMHACDGTALKGGDGRTFSKFWQDPARQRCSHTCAVSKVMIDQQGSK
jgi:hypothetical protein